MEKVNLPNMSNGPWKIEKFITDRTDWGSLKLGRAAPIGAAYTRLLYNGRLIMSDTPAEMADHWAAVRHAAGSCLLNGLGLGMVLKNILLKPEVTDVTVVEISQDLIDMVAPHYADPKIMYICADAFTYKPPKGKRYGMVWHDIWADLCTDNLADMARLHRKYGRCADWQGSWGKEFCQSHRRRNRRSYY